MDCLFCKIIAGEIPSKKVYEDDQIYAFYDIEPQAKTHVLIVPKAHIQGAGEITAKNSDVIAHIFERLPSLAKQMGLDGGFRVVTNWGDDGCQSVKHLHFHLLGGQKLSGQMC